MKVTNKSVLFWGRNDEFSNFYMSPFWHEGIQFHSSEQAVMWEKANLFDAATIADRILAAKRPEDCKRLGRSRSIPFDEAQWVANREDIYYRVLVNKFSDPKLQKVLLATGNKTLIEASPFDDIWGVKMDENHPDVESPDKWKGLNLLGKVLERVRTYHRKER
ncbi:hypothetical protein [Bacillus phage SDFMU_Pbc]|uniref:NADAR domain-containing protein n=1 Tax=Bacillus phage SDFMU_Pbc TaxID=3076135 RepID=A0AA96R1H5_9CAUD|nr:hypothetical protein [Bacillus phage SDFMU_Pbc]